MKRIYLAQSDNQKWLCVWTSEKELELSSSYFYLVPCLASWSGGREAQSSHILQPEHTITYCSPLAMLFACYEPDFWFAFEIVAEKEAERQLFKSPYVFG
jgi:hypothetical protein